MESSSEKPNDCFLCNLIPAFRVIFPNRDNIIVDTPSVAAAKRNQGIPTASVASAASPLKATPNNRGIIPQEDDEYHTTNMDFASADYRGFVFCLHPQHGFMLLHCTRKKKKPNHFQLPGGHIDAFEFTDAAKALSDIADKKGGASSPPIDPQEQLVLAGKLGAARELYEETGMDLRHQLDRLKPAKLFKKDKKGRVSNEYKSRLFYVLHLTDDDFLRADDMPIADAAFLQRPMGAQPPNLNVSHDVCIYIYIYIYIDSLIDC